MITKTLVCRMSPLEQANPAKHTFLYIRSSKAEARCRREQRIPPHVMTSFIGLHG